MRAYQLRKVSNKVKRKLKDPKFLLEPIFEHLLYAANNGETSLLIKNRPNDEYFKLIKKHTKFLKNRGYKLKFGIIEGRPSIGDITSYDYISSIPDIYTVTISW